MFSPKDRRLAQSCDTVRCEYTRSVEAQVVANGTAGMDVEAASTNFHNRRYPFREKWLDARHIVGNPPLHVAPSVSVPFTL